MSPFERAMLWGSSLLVGASGIVYAVMKYLMRTDDPYAVIHHPLQPLVLKIHIVAAPLLVFAVGTIFVRHVGEQWRGDRARGRRSGVATTLTFAPMVLSGYLIQALNHRGWLSAMVVVHLVTGSAFLLVFLAHRGALASRAGRGRCPVAPSAATMRVTVGPGNPRAPGGPHSDG